MKVTIDRISNGYVIAIAGTKGVQAIFKSTWAEVVEELGSLKIDGEPAITVTTSTGK